MERKGPVERRKYLRFDLETKVKIHVKKRKDSKASLRKITGQSKNFCIEGICFTSDSKLKPGTKIKLEIFLSTEKKPLQLEGEVMWSRLEHSAPDKVMVDTGVKLKAITKTDESRLFASILAKHKQLEKALSDSESKYRTLLKNIPQRIFYKDLNSVYLLCNESYADDLNIYPDEIRGKTDYNFYNRKLAEKYIADDKRIIQTGEKEEVEEKYIRRGEEIIVNTIKAPVRDEKGNIIGIFGIFWDITDRKKAEEELRRSEADYHTIFDSVNDGIFVYNIETGKTIAVNRRLSQLFGYSREDFKRLNLALLGSGRPPYTQEEALSWQKKSIMAGPQLFEWQVKNKSGRLFWVEVHLKKVLIGEKECVLGVVRDINERKKAQAEVEKAMVIKSEFISMVSHELRTPITSIQEGINIVLEEGCGKVNRHQKKYLDIAKRNVDRLSRLINDVLNFQKLEAGKMEFNIQKNSVNETVKEVYKAMKTLAAGKKLTFSLHLEGKLPAIKFDKDKIIQVLTNVIDNAIKFTSEGGISVTTVKKGNTICVSVKDTGCGIRKEDMPRLFHKFEQLSSVKYRKTGGTGLGLAISKRIIGAHKGKIWAESKFGEGTTFYFLLPIKEKRG